MGLFFWSTLDVYADNDDGLRSDMGGWPWPDGQPPMKENASGPRADDNTMSNEGAVSAKIRQSKVFDTTSLGSVTLGSCVAT